MQQPQTGPPVHAVLTLGASGGIAHRDICQVLVEVVRAVLADPCQDASRLIDQALVLQWHTHSAHS